MQAGKHILFSFSCLFFTVFKHLLKQTLQGAVKKL